MSNMSYCRWENTLSDLNDCIDSVDECDRHDEMYDNNHEWRAKKRMLEQVMNLRRWAEDELQEMEDYEASLEEEE